MTLIIFGLIMAVYFAGVIVFMVLLMRKKDTEDAAIHATLWPIILLIGLVVLPWAACISLGKWIGERKERKKS